MEAGKFSFKFSRQTQKNPVGSSKYAYFRKGFSMVLLSMYAEWQCSAGLMIESCFGLFAPDSTHCAAEFFLLGFTWPWVFCSTAAAAANAVHFLYRKKGQRTNRQNNF
jgi:hypothetical protein